MKTLLMFFVYTNNLIVHHLNFILTWLCTLTFVMYVIFYCICRVCWEYNVISSLHSCCTVWMVEEYWSERGMV